MREGPPQPEGEGRFPAVPLRTSGDRESESHLGRGSTGICFGSAGARFSAAYKAGTLP